MIYLATTVWRFLDARTAHCITNTVMNAREDVRWEVGEGSALICRARSRMASLMLDTDTDVLVFIDDDITFYPRDFWKIVEGAREKQSVYGGVYMTRGKEPKLAFRPLKSEIHLHQAEQREPEEVRYLSTGFMAIPRLLLEEMTGAEFKGVDGRHRLHYCDQFTKQPFWNFFAPFVVKRQDGMEEYLSEDWAFCERARQLGYKVWTDTSIWLGHIGTVTLTPMDAVIKGHAKSAQGIPSAMEYAAEYIKT